MSPFPFRPWYRHHRRRHRQLLGILSGLALVVILVVGQVGWSAPETISAPALMARLNTNTAPLILDVRSPSEYAAGHIPGALNIPYREIPDQLATLSEFLADEVVVYCEVGVRAGVAEIMLEQAGFQQVVPLEGDMRGWREAGLPISTEIPENTP
ncbi:MAG: rhodanese-like domain-containing protein [Leptolyngbya sp. SIOISBB]|nr:rhodanese-like domain-containing protein [Leptolyngbya sp. SIOISBB]